MIQRELTARGILSPTGKEKWALRSVDEILSNDKYTGNVRLLKTVNQNGVGSGRTKNRGQGLQFIVWQCHPPIIPQEDFDRVQEEKKKRTNRILSESRELKFRQGYKYSGKSSKLDKNS